MTVREERNRDRRADRPLQVSHRFNGRESAEAEADWGSNWNSSPFGSLALSTLVLEWEDKKNMMIVEEVDSAMEFLYKAITQYMTWIEEIMGWETDSEWLTDLRPSFILINERMSSQNETHWGDLPTLRFFNMLNAARINWLNLSDYEVYSLPWSCWLCHHAAVLHARCG